MFASVLVVLLTDASASATEPLRSISTAVGCTADEQCLNRTDGQWRCLQSKDPGAIPCALDYKYNETGLCACASQKCTPTAAPKLSTKKQYLVIGDSISDGYLKALKQDLLSGYEVVHAPGNNGNVNWGSHCLAGWLGADPSRWDVITLNFGLHDLAFPDNEHVDVGTYATLLGKIIAQLQQKTKAKLIWVTTTPVPTDPSAKCILLPGRIESDVQKYNAAAAAVVKGAAIGVCDAHAAIIAECGVGYASCSIAQCQGPHFSEEGFALLAKTVSTCVSSSGQ